MKAKTKRHRKQIHTSTEAEEEETETNPANFAFSITKVAVSRICRSIGFKGAQSSAVEVLTFIGTKYLQQLANAAASYSNAANRTESNIFDLTNALHDMSFEQQGFVGASTLHRQSSSNNCLLNRSSILKELASFVKCGSKETPFAKPIPYPRKNIILNQNSVSVSGSYGYDSDSRSLHFPKWLPAFPDERSYKGSNETGVLKGNNNSKLWENSGMVKGGSCNYGGDGGVSKEKLQNWSGDLSKERGKVRFKIGVKGKGEDHGVGIGVDIMENWVCRGEERVCWNGGDNDLIEQAEVKNGFKRRRRC